MRPDGESSKRLGGVELERYDLHCPAVEMESYDRAIRRDYANLLSFGRSSYPLLGQKGSNHK